MHRVLLFFESVVFVLPAEYLFICRCMEKIDKILEDEELGLLVIRVNPRAKRLIFRTKSDAIYVSVPPGTTSAEITDAINQLRVKLLQGEDCSPIDRFGLPD